MVPYVQVINYETFNISNKFKLPTKHDLKLTEISNNVGLL